MVIVAVVIAGLLVGALGLIGFLDAVRGTPVRKVLPFGPDLPSVEDPAFRTSMELVSRTALCDGNEAVQDDRYVFPSRRRAPIARRTR